MICVERPALPVKEEKAVEVVGADGEALRADLEFVAAMGGVELASMSDGEGVASHE